MMLVRIEILSLVVGTACLYAADYSGKDLDGIEELVREVEQAQEGWRRDANDRIERYRKADLNITVIDDTDRPVPGADVSVSLVKHAFEYGVAVHLVSMFGFRKMPVDPDVYQAAVPHFCTKAGFVNYFKYKLTHNRRDKVAQGVKWFKEAGTPLRGHCLIWPGQSHLPRELQDLVFGHVPKGKKINWKTPYRDDIIDADRQKIRGMCEHMVIDWARSWDVADWDVVNESRGNHAIQDICGREVMVDWFKLAAKHMVNRGGGLYLNENRVISCPERQAARHLQHYCREVKYLLDNGAPISGLGFQTRMKYDEPAEEIWRRLEIMAKFKLPMAATEHEVSPFDGVDEDLRARITERVLTVYFSHPLVAQFIAWTFFSPVNEATGTSKDQGLLWADGRVKKNGKIWLWLWKQHWTTQASIKTDAGGKASVRGFLGTYAVAASHKGKRKGETVMLPKGGESVRIRLR